MEFRNKRSILAELRQAMAGVVQHCMGINGPKRAKTNPVNKKIWDELHPAALKELRDTAATERWTAQAVLDCALRLFYCTLVVNLESRNRVVAYDYMDFARRIGEVWEDFCKVCWDFPVNTELRRLKPESFQTVRRSLLDQFATMVRASGAQDADALMREYHRVIDLLGNINLTEDEYCAVGDKRIVIDFKSGFGSNEKGNTERLLTVAKIYHLLPGQHECALVVRAAEGEGNNYLRVLKSSGLWNVCCGPEAYTFIQDVTRFDLAAWIRTNVAFREDMEREVYQHLEQQHLTKYLVW
jgi:hypothetical protein